MAAERKEDFKKQQFISTKMVSGLRRSFILHLCIFRLRCNFEENSLHFGQVSAMVLSSRIKQWLKLPKCSKFSAFMHDYQKIQYSTLYNFSSVHHACMSMVAVAHGIQKAYVLLIVTI